MLQLELSIKYAIHCRNIIKKIPILINIKPLKEKDLVELKRAINKLKKTCDAMEGDIAGFGDDYIVITPSFAEIYRTEQSKSVKEQ